MRFDSGAKHLAWREELTATGSMLARHGEAIADQAGARRPVKSRIIAIIGLITCIWWPTVNLLYYRGRTVVQDSVSSRTSS